MAGSGMPHCLECGRPLPAASGRGRRREYCDATCRSAARRRRDAATAGATVNADLTARTRQAMLDSDAEGPALADVVTANRLVREAQDRLRQSVERAREGGHTWQEIGDVLGTTRQAAFQRFGRPVDPRTGEPMGEAIVDGAVEHAIGLLADCAAGRWKQVRRDFNDTMLAAVDAPTIAAVWARVIGSVGRYERMGEPFVRQVGDLTVVDVPLHFEAGECVGQVSYDPDRKVAGFYLMPTPS